MSSLVMVRISTIEAIADTSGLVSNIVEITIVDEDQTVEILDQLTDMVCKNDWLQ